jgi:hypothetical protein
MTYRELAEKIEWMTEQQKDLDVTVFDMNDEEFYALKDLDFVKEDDVLDKGHPFLRTFIEVSEK